MGRKLFLGLICVLSLIGTAWGKQDIYQEGEVLVVFKNIGPGSTVRNYIRGPVTDKYVKNVISDIIVPQAKVMQEIDEVKKGLSRISMPVSEDVELTIARFARSNNVVYAQPNFKYKVCATTTPLTPNDQRFGLHQWALNNTGQSGVVGADISAPEGWGYTTGDANVVVAILDTGVQYTHPDLAANMWNDPNVDPNDDGTGGLHGWDIAGALEGAYDPDGDPQPSDDAENEARGHGTHVAGIVGAVGNDSNGITGVCWTVSLMAVKVFADDSETCLTSDTVLGISYAVSKGANVINASLQGFSYDTAFLSAIQNANTNNVVFVAAAGNYSRDNDSSPVYPANYNQQLPNVISVMATNSSDNIAYYSDFGATTVDIAAPGGEGDTNSVSAILSTIPGEAETGSYTYYQGTSMAAPHVAGAVALMFALDPNISAADAKAMITHPLNVDRIPSLAGMCVSEGRLNLYKTLRAANSVKAINAGTNRVNVYSPASVLRGSYPQIMDAINHASTVSGDTVVADCNYWYFEAVDFKGKNITLQSRELANLALTIDIQDTMISTLFVPATSTVTFTNAETTGAVLQGFTVCDSTNAGVDVNIATPTITDCIITWNENPGILLKDSNGIIITKTNITYNNSDNNSYINGAGIYCANSLPDISLCNINNNIAVNLGGGIFMTSNSAGKIYDCNIVSNESDKGAGILITGGSDPNIYDCNIVSNIATDDGGGLYIDPGTSIVRDCNIIGNQAAGDGGGMYLSSATSQIHDINFVSNFTKFRGGGIFAYGNVADVNTCKFTSNTAGDGVYYPFPEGGAIYYYNANSATNSNSNLIDCEFSQNAAYLDGGAVFVHRGSGLDIQNCLFERNNSLSYDGGAIYLESSSPTINNCTFASNTNPDGGIGIGGAIFCNVYWKTSTVGSSPVITNSIFSGNRYYAVAEWSANSDASMQYCLFYNNNSGDLYDYDTAKAYYENATGSQFDFDEFTADTNLNLLNIGGDPNFVTGALGNYYLAQYAAGQTITGDSNALDGGGIAGAVTAASVGLDTYQTSTDSSINDSGVVDLGYHYKDPIATPNVDLVFSLLSLDNEVLSDTDVNLTPDAGTYHDIYKQYSEVELISVIENSDYEFVSWNGTGSDAISGKNMSAVKPTYRKIVIMDSARTVVFNVQYALVWVFISLDANSEAPETIIPKKGDNYLVRRGTVVTLTAIPVNKSNAIIWSGTNHDEWITTKNELTAQGGTDGVHTVSVRFYAPRTRYVSSDMSYMTIQLAINDSSDRDIVELKPGTYGIYESSEDHPRIEVYNKAITIKGSDPQDPCVVAQTLIIGGFVIDGVGRNMIIDGITITGNYVNGDGCDGSTECNPHVDGMNGVPHTGGGIRLQNSASPTIRNTVFDRCSSRGGKGGNGATGGDGGWGGWSWGGGIYIDQSSNPYFENVTFRNCSVNPGSGGDGGTNPPGHGGSWGVPTDPRWHYGPYQPVFRYSGFGGAVFCDQGSMPEFVDCNFIGNKANGSYSGISGAGAPAGWPMVRYRIPRFGGAVYIAANSAPKFTNCYFKDNMTDVNSPGADGVNIHPYIGMGGAVAFDSGAAPEFDGCTFEENWASLGGAINSDYSDPIIENSTFTGNSALFGGAIQLLGSSGVIVQCNFQLNDANGLSGTGGAIESLGSDTVILDTTFMYNSATGTGGGIYVSNKDVDGNDIYGNRETLIKNCLVVNNTSVKGGGGIAASGHGEPNIVNCTIADNTVTGAGNDNNYGGGIYCYDKGYAKLLNTIVWGNNAMSGIGNQLAATGDASHFAAFKVAYSNIQGGPGYPGIFIDDECMLEWDTRSNLNGLTTNPLFVIEEGYYLSQDPCQTTESNCVDTGSDTADAVGFYRHSTSTDGTLDTNTVDIGYHYILTTTLTGDLDYDGDVDFSDIVLLNMKWLYNDCVYPDWCQGRDINQDGAVNYLDYTLISGEYGDIDPNLNNAANDTIAPQPNPMTWAVVPHATGTTTIDMNATTAYDNQGSDIQYEFARVNANGEPTGQQDVNDVTGAVSSGWQEEKSWTDTGLLKNMSYSYRVRAKDSKGNMTDLSTQIQSATTTRDGTIDSDHTAPAWPASGAWAITPYATDANAPGEIYMRANTAYDISTPVQYRFTIKKNGATVTAYSSSWQTDRNWTATSVFGGTYSVYVEAKDAAGNITALSTAVVVTIAGDGDAPVSVASPLTATPSISGGKVYLTLTSAAPTDATLPIYYRFSSSNSGYNKLPGVNVWLTSNTLTIYMNIGMSSSRWYVEFMDGAGNATVTKYPAPNGVEVPLTQAD
jgi:predicted outer membrane repeat protein